MIKWHRLVFLFLGMVVLVGFVGCSSTTQEEELLTELTDMNKTEIFEKAEALYADGKTEDARSYFSFVYDTFPNDPLGHKAALRVADTYATKKDAASLTEARLRYRDFANRYPNDPDRDYALLMVGQTYSARQMKPDRDLSTVEEALNAYRQLLTLYPNSQYYDDAQNRIGQLLDVLAEHEMITAEYYARNKRWLAASWRIEYLKEHYPEFEGMDEVDALYEKVRGEITAAQDHLKQLIERKQQEAKEAQKGTEDQPAAEKPQ